MQCILRKDTDPSVRGVGGGMGKLREDLLAENVSELGFEG